MNFALALGIFLLGGAAGCAVLMHGADRRLQSYRRNDIPSSSFTLVPLRVRQSLYTAEGKNLVDRFWVLFVAMLVLFVAGSCFLSLGS